ncbi:MAG: hypothetical protein INQ03_25210 [Candidatus Heimdallarchaeota archaeon]|nr:hypothetical protein [Candidatus Heimdallarchaeota archaeon]
MYRIFSLLLFSIFLISPYTAIDIQEQLAIDEPDVLEFRGLNYGHYRDDEGGPGSGEVVPIELVKEDLQIMKDLGTTDIRTYRTSDGLETLPQLSLEYGITTAVATWISPTTDNYAGIDNALTYENYSSMTILGNEVLMRGEYKASEFQDFVNYANEKKSNGSKIAVAEPYYVFLNHPSLVVNVDVLLVHIYPAWETIPIEDAAQYTIDKFNAVKEKFPDKEILIGEMGWPSGPSGPFTHENQVQYYSDVLPLLYQHNISAYLFVAFDENWKSEGKYDPDFQQSYEIGPHWGIIEEDRLGKPAAEVVANYFGGTVELKSYARPMSTQPEDIETSLGSVITITWVITDNDSLSGTFSLFKNNFSLGISDLVWSDEEEITINVDTSSAGIFEYEIRYADELPVIYNDIVLVTVVDPADTSDTSFTPSSFSLLLLIGVPILRRNLKYASH